MASLESYRNKAFVDFCTQVLAEFAQDTNGVQDVILATPDGFAIATSNADNQSGDKLSAVGSSLFALGSSLVSEFDLEECSAITIDSSKGKVYIREISPNKDSSLILMVKANKATMLAHMLHGANKAAERIAKRMLLLS